MSNSATFIQHLRHLGRDEPGKVAILRRSLAFEPGDDVRSFPMVERYLPLAVSERDRKIYYLVAGLWALVNTASVLRTNGETDDEPATMTASPTEEMPPKGSSRRERRSLGLAIATLYLTRNRTTSLGRDSNRSRTTSIEKRFIALLDADEEQLRHWLRQMVQLLKAEDGIPIYWRELLDDLLRWSDSERSVQQAWARDFYRAINAAEAGGAESNNVQAEEGE